MNPSPSPAWHSLSPAAVCESLHTGAEGLTTAEAARRLAATGPNELRAAPRGSAWALLAAQFKNALIVILLVATAASAVLGHAVEAGAITVIVLFAVLLGFVQEYRAERALEALAKMAAPHARVLRDGVEAVVPAREVVPGDLLLLAAGDHVAADARLVHAVELQAQEAPLTGESTPVAKAADAQVAAAAQVGDRRTMVYAGTAVTHGRGRAVVVATGAATEFGRIAGMLSRVEVARTPLQMTLDRLGRSLARAALAVVAVIVVLGLLRGQPFVEMLVFGIALAVAVVPEALPAVVTISLALGVQRLARRRALMRRLPAVETLGSTSVICTDKTGTLTRDEMTVRAVYLDGRELEVTGAGYAPEGEFRHGDVAVAEDPLLHRLLRAAALANDARLHQHEGRWRIHGDPTEGALVVAAAKAGLDKPALDAAAPRMHEFPFTAESQRMTTVHADGDGHVAYAKGAPEVIVDCCRAIATREGDEPLTDAARAEVLGAAQAMASRALRVLAIATRERVAPPPQPSPASGGGGNSHPCEAGGGSGVSRSAASRRWSGEALQGRDWTGRGGGAAPASEYQRGLTLLGLVGMIDPPRPEARAAIATCAQAGIRVVMITGDHPATALAVARELGLATQGQLVTGAQLDALTDAQLARQVASIEVYARVSPAHKLRVVEALQAQGEVVAMTGDGVNDAPALKRADIGVAMGVSGTDVAREAAAMTLTDDNFATIVAAVEEGRGIFANIRKYLAFLLSSNLGEIGLMAGTALAGLPLPLSAVQILYVNLATDGLPALALAVDPPADDLMRQPPRPRREGVFTRPLLVLMLIAGLWSTLATLGLFAWALGAGRSERQAMTLVFVALVLIQFVNAFNFRSERRSLLHRPWANTWLNLSLLWEVWLLALIVGVPWLQRPFGIVPPSAGDLVLAIGVALTIAPVLEAAKWLLRRHEPRASVE
ncbi:MAG: cation-translocating P-type ATPase [Betaproteobacteria bacterium]